MLRSMIVTNILCFFYGSLFTLMTSLWFRNRAEHKLRTEHRKELDTLRGTSDAERDALRGAPYILPAQPASPYSTAYNGVGLTETLKLLKKEHEVLSKRVGQLERERQSGAA